MATHTKFEADHYSITVTGLHVQVTEAMKQYAIEKLAKIEKFTEDIIDIHVTMDIEKLSHIVEISIKLKYLQINSRSKTSDMYASVNEAVSKIEKQIRRYKTRLQKHQSTPLEFVDLQVNVIRPHQNDQVEEINDAIEEENQRRLEAELRPHDIVGREILRLKTLNETDAVMKMELSGDHFLLYRDEESREITVIYRLEDGNYGIVRPK